MDGGGLGFEGGHTVVGWYSIHRHRANCHWRWLIELEIGKWSNVRAL